MQITRGARAHNVFRVQTMTKKIQVLIQNLRPMMFYWHHTINWIYSLFGIATKCQPNELQVVGNNYFHVRN
jgi:hypothetical protein